MKTKNKGSVVGWGLHGEGGGREREGGWVAWWGGGGGGSGERQKDNTEMK